MFAIAIISLIGLALGIISGLIDIGNDKTTRSYIIITTIATIAWWELSFPTAIVILVVGVLWAVICILNNHVQNS